MEAMIVNGDPTLSRTLTEVLDRAGYTTYEAETMNEARQRIRENPMDLVLLNADRGDPGAVNLLNEFDALTPTHFVVLTDQGPLGAPPLLEHAGIVEYLPKPIDLESLQNAISRPPVWESGVPSSVKSKTSSPTSLSDAGIFCGHSDPIVRIHEMIRRVAPTEATVMITGETGVGKELVARHIHALSRRSSEPFMPVNCGAISPTLIESEIFGHERGSFTGSHRRHRGYFEQANGGTLFLDEITEMNQDMQVKLLRALETGVFQRVGSDAMIKVDVRVIAATNTQPPDAIRNGKLREDLFFRLNVFPIRTPPLREHPEDIDALSHHFLEILRSTYGGEKTICPKALERLRAYHWPGNIRELKNMLHRAYIMANDQITREQVDAYIEDSLAATSSFVQIPLGVPMEEVEYRLILATIDHFNGNKRQAAQALGISLKTIYNRLNVHKSDM